MDDTFDDSNEYEDTNTFNPQSMDSGTFIHRNDPEKLLFRFKLQLMNAYTKEEQIKDKITGKIKKVIRIKQKPRTKPKLNSQGIEDIMGYIEKYINSHVVQGNILDYENFKERLRFISLDATQHFISKRKKWDIELDDCEILISNTVGFFDLFLTRTLYNEERKSYGESYKETVHKDLKPEADKNIFQKFGQYISGR